jgi:ADP-heptose:LPS heptosyltransferase
MAPYKLGQDPLYTSLTAEERIAFITSHRLGDSLLGMILVHNMLKHGYPVEVFSQVVFQLRDWFPGVTVFPFSELKTRAASYAHLWYERPNRKVASIRSSPNQSVIVLKESPFYGQTLPVSNVFQLFCRQELGIEQPVIDNGLIRPASLEERIDIRKIMIHPTSSSWLKTWKLSGFLKVAQLLQDQGFHVEFIVSPAEKQTAEQILDMGLRCFIHSDLDFVARQLSQAAWFIGNDSGIGQLASNVGAKTITLFPLTRRAQRWKPCWGPSLAVCPTLSEKIPETVRTLLWKNWITPEAVIKTFQQLRKEIDSFGEGIN